MSKAPPRKYVQRDDRELRQAVAQVQDAVEVAAFAGMQVEQLGLYLRRRYELTEWQARRLALRLGVPER
jgi:hypothetical protein